MQITSTMLRRIAAMPEQAMAEALVFLAEQLETDEARRGKVAARQARYRDAHRNVDKDVTVTPTVTLQASRVDNLSSLPVLIEPVSTPFNPPSKPKNPSEHPAFQSLWDVYPKRAGDRARKGAVKAFGPALKRAASADAIIDGAMRYAAFCDATGKTDTEFVQQCRTWLNDNGWEKPWDIPRSNTNGIHDNWAKASAVLREQDRREGICREGSEDDLRALSEPEGRTRIFG